MHTFAMAIGIDFFVGAVILVSILAGYKRGFIKMILSFIFLIIAAVAASIAADAIDDFITDKLIMPAAQKTLTEYVTSVYDEFVTEIIPIDEFSKNYHSGVLTANELNDIINIKAKAFVDILSEYADRADLPVEVELASSGFDSTITVFDSDDVAVRAATLESPVEPVVNFLMINTLRPAILRIVGSIAFTVLFIIIIALLGIVVKMTGVINKVPIVGGVNRFAGAILGLLVAITILYVLSRIALIFFDGNLALQTFVDRTFVTKYIFWFLTETDQGGTII
jgi:uncharacterized membrane protein required for colicin V production